MLGVWRKQSVFLLPVTWLNFN